ncbi:MAG: hypothetical protein QOD77_651 [Thermoplasmata archaeon]|jgi:hypothetical protein|nr:hypothetical protein [Thermoplasmata archaeon]
MALAPWALALLLLLPAAEAARVELPPWDVVQMSVGDEATVPVPVRVGCAGNEAWIDPVVQLVFEQGAVKAAADPLVLDSRPCLSEAWDLEVPVRFTTSPDAMGDQEHALRATATLRTAQAPAVEAVGEARVALAFHGRLAVGVGPPEDVGGTRWVLSASNVGDSPIEVRFELDLDQDDEVVGAPILPTPVPLQPGETAHPVLHYVRGPATTLWLVATAASLRDGTVGEQVRLGVDAPPSGRQVLDLPAPAFAAGLLAVGLAAALRRPRG